VEGEAVQAANEQTYCITEQREGSERGQASGKETRNDETARCIEEVQDVENSMKCGETSEDIHTVAKCQPLNGQPPEDTGDKTKSGDELERARGRQELHSGKVNRSYTQPEGGADGDHTEQPHKKKQSNGGTDTYGNVEQKTHSPKKYKENDMPH